MEGLFDYYRMKTDENNNIVFERVKEDDIKINGKSIKEIITILNGLDIERITEIQMTMENLSYLFKKAMQKQDTLIRRNIFNKTGLNIDF